MPKLYILCGPSGCGKSTWAHNFLNNTEDDIRYVSRDEIRFSMLKEDDDYFAHETEVYRHFTGTLRETLVDGFDVIADATHLTKASRKRLTQAIDTYYKDYEIIYVVFHTTFDQCVLNDMGREGLAQVGIDVISGMFRSYVIPTLDEDPRAIQIIDVGEGDPNNYSYLNWPYQYGGTNE